MSAPSSLAGAGGGHAARQTCGLSPAAALDLARTAYAADADHVARDLLIGLLIDGTASEAEVGAAVQDGMRQFNARRRLLAQGQDSGRSAGII